MKYTQQKLFTVNLDEIISSYAWKRFMKCKNLIQRQYLNLRKKDYDIDIMWGCAQFKHKTTSFKLRDLQEEATKQLAETAADDTASGNPKNLGATPSIDKDGNRNVALYYSEYENLTPVDQQYTFSTTRETKASTSVEFQNTYTKGGSAGIELSVPGDFLTVNAGLSGELSVTDSKSQSFEETMTWEVNTQITVKAGHKTQATMYVAEKKCLADFKVTSSLSLPDGKDLPVMIRRKSDNETVYVDIITDLKPVFNKVTQRNSEIMTLVKCPDEKRHMMRSKLEILSEGTCKSLAWRNQHVHVDSFEIKGIADTQSLLPWKY